MINPYAYPVFYGAPYLAYTSMTARGIEGPNLTSSYSPVGPIGMQSNRVVDRVTLSDRSSSSSFRSNSPYLHNVRSESSYAPVTMSLGGERSIESFLGYGVLRYEFFANLAQSSRINVVV